MLYFFFIGDASFIKHVVFLRVYFSVRYKDIKAIELFAIRKKNTQFPQKSGNIQGI
jgi:hypothetical protein